MNKIIKTICLIGLILVSPVLSVNAVNKVELSREFEAEGNTLITEFGNNQTIEVDSDGNVVWQKTGLIVPHDAERLQNGNTLIVEVDGNRVIEVDIDGNVIWNKTGLTSPMDAERLSNGNTLITEYGIGRVIEVDTDGNIVWEISELDSAFDAERLLNGNTLIVESWPDGRIIEIDSEGNIVWNKTGFNGPVDVERLVNGNTLITEHIGKKIIEIDSNGNVVWQKTGLQVPKDAERLSNGNTLIAELGANRIIEVDSDGNIVWQKTGLYWPTDVERLSNQPPNITTITGSTSGKVGIPHTYVFNAIDPDEDYVRYVIDWGDVDTETTAFNPSGSDVQVQHTWSEEGTYTITASAEDIEGFFGPEATFEVTMPRNKATSSSLFLWFLERLQLFNLLFQRIWI